MIARLVTDAADGAGRVLGRGLAAAVARRPGADLQDAPGRGGERRRADVELVPDPLEAQVEIIEELLPLLGIPIVGPPSTRPTT